MCRVSGRVWRDALATRGRPRAPRLPWCDRISRGRRVGIGFAEPGDPHLGERHTGLESAYEYATLGFGGGKDLFHRNVLKILSMCWPELSFEQQLRKAWLTESVLCSARKEGGSVSVAASRACGRRYLLAQLAEYPSALVVALGKKAQSRLLALGFRSFLPVFAAAPPGCNRREALASWAKIPAELERRRQLRAPP